MGPHLFLELFLQVAETNAFSCYSFSQHHPPGSWPTNGFISAGAIIEASFFLFFFFSFFMQPGSTALSARTHSDLGENASSSIRSFLPFLNHRLPVLPVSALPRRVCPLELGNLCLVWYRHLCMFVWPQRLLVPTNPGWLCSKRRHLTSSIICSSTLGVRKAKVMATCWPWGTLNGSAKKQFILPMCSHWLHSKTCAVVWIQLQGKFSLFT